MRKMLTLAPLLALAACAEMSLEEQILTAGYINEAALVAAELVAAPKADRAELIGVVGAEVAARLRCQKGALMPIDAALLANARAGFDLTFRARLSDVSVGIVDRLRLRTDAACGIDLP